MIALLMIYTKRSNIIWLKNKLYKRITTTDLEKREIIWPKNKRKNIINNSVAKPFASPFINQSEVSSLQSKGNCPRCTTQHIKLPWGNNQNNEQSVFAYKISDMYQNYIRSRLFAVMKIVHALFFSETSEPLPIYLVTRPSQLSPPHSDFS